MDKIIQFFIEEHGVDLSNTKVFFVALNTAGSYDPVDDVVYINKSHNSITRELTLVHEFTHRMVALNKWEMVLDKEETFCKETTLEYAGKTFGEESIDLIKELV